MRIKNLYLILSFVSISLLLSGVGYIYLDGKREISLEKEYFRNQVTENLKYLNFISNLKKVTEIDWQTKDIIKEGFPELKKELSQAPFVLDILAQEEWRSIWRVLETFRENILNRNKLVEKKNQLNKKLEESWQAVESFLQEEIQQRVKDGKDFLPGVKQALASWGEDIPFFEMMKQSIDISYVDKKKFGELKELVLFSQHLIQTKSELTKNSINLDQKFKEISKELLNSHIKKEVQNKVQEMVRSHFVQLKEKNKIDLSLSEFEREQLATKEKIIHMIDSLLIARWEKRQVSLYQENITRAGNRYDMVLKASILLSIVVIVVMLLLFMKIFPYLGKLEDNAKEISSGVFSKRFDYIPNNEMGRVMLAFNLMAAEIEKTILKLKDEESHKRELLESIQKMKRMNEMGELTSKIAHEIKNPLSILSLCMEDAYEAIQSSSLDGTKKEIEKARVALGRLVALVSKLNTRSTAITFSDISINILIQDLLSMYQGIVEKEGVELLVQGKISDRVIRGAHLELLSALTNLIDNAVEDLNTHPEIEKRIFLETRELEGKSQIIVKNQGRFIQNSERLFTTFFSTKGGASRGLGLTIVKDILDQLEGNIIYHHENGWNLFILEFSVSSSVSE